MEWNWLAAGDGIIAAGAENVYLVSYQTAAGDISGVRLDMSPAAVWDISGVRLTRYRAPNAVASAVAQEAALNTIVFPLGRGPGRPAGSLELHALTAMAKDYADQYEAGSSLPGHPAWQQLASAPPESAAVHLTEQPSAGYPAVMLFIGTGPARKRFSCPRCHVTVFTRASLASAQYICNGCGAQYEGTPLPGDTPAGTDPYAITYLGGGADGRAHC